MGRRPVSKKPAAKKNPANKNGKASDSNGTASPDALSPAEVAQLNDQLKAEAKSDRSWRAMTAAEPEDGDKWGAVEDHLRQKPCEHDAKLRRWKFFAK